MVISVWAVVASVTVNCRPDWLLNASVIRPFVRSKSMLATAPRMNAACRMSLYTGTDPEYSFAATMAAQLVVLPWVIACTSVSQPT
ncbi:hypothetical protein D3C86_1653920 [compost metagenome]